MDHAFSQLISKSHLNDINCIYRLTRNAMNSTPKTTNTTAEPVAHSTTTATAPAHVVKAVVTTKRVAATKPMVKAASKQTKVEAVAKPSRKVAAKPAPQSDAKPVKTKKPKMIRDSFTMPKAEFAVIETLKARAAALKVPTKKTELIRAGIKALANMGDTAFLNAVRNVPNLKTGRPAKDE
jgi:hypothetical protein